MRPIAELCRRPQETRAAAIAGEQTPCYHCIAYRPETTSGCDLIEKRADVPKVSPVRQPKPRQETIW